MAEHSPKISVIIPLRDGDAPLPTLLRQLENAGMEIILSHEGSRAKSLNIGAQKARGKYLWFLHGDSILSDNALDKLQHDLTQKPEALHYFTLAFSETDSSKMHLNAWGANMRCAIFKTPFGDQGFCIRKDLYAAIGGYDESAKYGEDHLFTWHARRKKIKLNRVNATITTSASTYDKNGWLKTTLLYQYLWIKQALPQAWLLLTGK